MSTKREDPLAATLQASAGAIRRPGQPADTTAASSFEEPAPGRAPESTTTGPGSAESAHAAPATAQTRTKARRKSTGPSRKRPGRNQLNVTLSSEAKEQLEELLNAAPGVITRTNLIEQLILRFGAEAARSIATETIERLNES